MSYQKGQQFQFEREGYQIAGHEELPHKETLTIEEVTTTKSSFGFMPDQTSYKVHRHFVADGVDTTTEVTLTERELDAIVNRQF